jgi:hypothetical protein
MILGHIFIAGMQIFVGPWLRRNDSGSAGAGPLLGGGRRSRAALVPGWRSRAALAADDHDEKRLM